MEVWAANVAMEVWAAREVVEVAAARAVVEIAAARAVVEVSAAHAARTRAVVAQNMPVAVAMASARGNGFGPRGVTVATSAVPHAV